MVLHDYDSNTILAAPLKTKSPLHQLWATQALHGYLKEWELNPSMHVMDNKCPDTVKKYLRNNNVDFQLVLPHVYCMNAAKKAIGTFKYHFLAGPCSVHPPFPMHLSCHLIPLATTTLNLLHPSRINTRLLAKALLNGAFDYKNTNLPKNGTITTYLHCACFSPAPSTWTTAIDAGFFSTWPGLTSQLVRQNLPKSVATAKGHL